METKTKQIRSERWYNPTERDQTILLKCFDKISQLPFYETDKPESVLTLKKDAIYYDDFVEAIKFLMRTDADMKRGYYCEFNSDYTRLRKLKIEL